MSSLNENDDYEYSFDFRPFDVPGQGSCGTGGKKMVIRYEARSTGRLAYLFWAQRNSLIYVRRDCTEMESQIPSTCRGDSDQLISDIHVEEGEVLYFVIEGPTERATEMILLAGEFPYKEEEEACNLPAPLLPHQSRCAPGLTCFDVAAPGICSVNEAPTLHSVRAAPGGFEEGDLVLFFDGEDANGDAQTIQGWVFDAEGAPLVALEDAWRFGRLPNSIYLLPQGSLLSKTSFQGLAIAQGQLARLPEIRSIQVALEDRAGGTSTLVDLEIEASETMGEGEPCDPAWLQNRCDVGLTCHGDEGSAPTCRSLVDLRTAQCAAAPEVEIGASLEGRFNRSDAPPAGWIAPSSCYSNPFSPTKRPTSDPPQFLARLTLDRPRTNVDIVTEGTRPGIESDTVLMLYPDCGTVEPALACADDPPDEGRSAALHFDRLEAGDYLIVGNVLGSSQNGEWRLVVSADP